MADEDKDILSRLYEGAVNLGSSAINRVGREVKMLGPNFMDSLEKAGENANTPFFKGNFGGKDVYLGHGSYVSGDTPVTQAVPTGADPRTKAFMDANAMGNTNFYDSSMKSPITFVPVTSDADERRNKIRANTAVEPARTNNQFIITRSGNNTEIRNNPDYVAPEVQPTQSIGQQKASLRDALFPKLISYLKGELSSSDPISQLMSQTPTYERADTMRQLIHTAGAIDSAESGARYQDMKTAVGEVHDFKEGTQVLQWIPGRGWAKVTGMWPSQSTSSNSLAVKQLDMLNEESKRKSDLYNSAYKLSFESTQDPLVASVDASIARDFSDMPNGFGGSFSQMEDGTFVAVDTAGRRNPRNTRYTKGQVDRYLEYMKSLNKK